MSSAPLSFNIEGWVPFGFHAVEGPCPPVLFGDDRGEEDGLPVRERLDLARFPHWVRTQVSDALREAADVLERDRNTEPVAELRQRADRLEVQ